MALPKIEASIPFTSSVSMTVAENGGGGVAVTVVSGTALGYMLSTGNGDSALLTEIGDALTANASLAATYVLTLSTTGKVTISASGGGVTSFAITWTNTTLRDVLGFTSGDTVSGALTYTGSEQAEYLWFPGVGKTNPMTPEGSAGKPVSDLTITVASSGAHKALSGGTALMRYVDNLEFQFVLGNKIWTSLESVTNESFQKLWDKAVSTGRQLRYYPDATSTSNTVDYIAVPQDQGRFEFPCHPHNENWQGATAHYRVQLNVIKFVS